MTSETRGIPPFETMVSGFFIAFLAGIMLLASRGRLGCLRQRPLPWLIGVGGLFTYHALYFVALNDAPPAQAGLIAYLWPLFIVLFAAALPGGEMRARHLIGASMGLAGTGIILLGGAKTAGGSGGPVILGYGYAFGAAFVWAIYSVGNRRIDAVPSDLIAGVCGVVAALALAVHLAVEPTVVPTISQGLALLALGIGPVGLAFYLWDFATKLGDLALLGTLSYIAPLLSTGLLICLGRAALNGTIVAAAALIVGGAVLSARTTRPNQPPDQA